ncbi:MULTISPECIES: outer membrane protein [unclassified Bradyrhizobium]|uniref:outer membrane protein n=1 Tax=unclassified Bradyrhizobium TaxID=2631580 RepID=UPI001BAB61C1|nr:MULTISPECIES: outer membrane beta-barrel protein [unclassified Bradyrhizobium]MBR1227309.1 outer membrane beta-barrel protein [Bradyrhizobium sp. AUGA SZCCT0176]MBR1299247.1 outer membrane beta-barrel protein [Bradyrhizobium sp. AUGA SZCCT0042]
MKKLVLAAAILAASVVSAFAADMAARPYTKAPVAPPVITYDWSGIYIGGAVGGAWDTTDGVLYNAVPGAFWRTDSQSRLIYGGFAGIQKQWGNVVLGIEGGWNGLDNGFNNTRGTGVLGPGCIYGGGASCQSRINDIGYIGGRLGYAWNRFMVYGQGGYARADIDTQVYLPAANLTIAAASAAHGGWYAGVGGEYAVLDNLVLGIDYKHYEFDSEQHNCNRAVVGCTVVDLRNVSAKVDSVMGRVSFKFNPWSTGPVVARY